MKPLYAEYKKFRGMHCMPMRAADAWACTKYRLQRRIWYRLRGIEEPKPWSACEFTYQGHKVEIAILYDDDPSDHNDEWYRVVKATNSDGPDRNSNIYNVDGNWVELLEYNRESVLYEDRKTQWGKALARVSALTDRQQQLKAIRPWLRGNYRVGVKVKIGEDIEEACWGFESDDEEGIADSIFDLLRSSLRSLKEEPC